MGKALGFREPGDVPNVPQATPRTFALGGSSLVVENPGKNIVWLFI